jgi:serine protease Do
VSTIAKMSKMSEKNSILVQMNSELIELVKESLPRTCTVFPMQSNMKLGGHGSGWLYSREWIVTNHHVAVHSPSEVMIRMGGGGEVRAKVVGMDEQTDLAVLKVPKLSTEAFEIRPDPPQVGEICLALGTPKDIAFQNSVSFGVVSGVGRQVAAEIKFEEAIQTDAVINQGNSGGPLIDVRGRVIGVNSWGRNDAQGLNFAVSSEVVLDIVPEIIEHGKVKRASIGVAITARRMKSGSDFIPLVEITKTKDGSPMRPGDFIRSVNGKEISRRYDLMRSLNRSVVGKTVELEVEREGRRIKIEVLTEEKIYKLTKK